jgi:type I restriction enzyme S subunit
MRIQPDPVRLVREYIALLIQESYLVRTQLALASNATTIDVIYSDTLRQVLVPKPPLNEQVAILKRIDERVAEIYRFVEMVSEAIDRLKEYRTALISAAVTGKIDVCGEVVQ